MPSYSAGGKTYLASDYVSITTACEIVAVSRRTIYNWIAGKKGLVVQRHVGGALRIQVGSLFVAGYKPEEKAS